MDKGGPGLIGKRVEPVLNRPPVLPRTGVRQALIAADRLRDLARLSLQVAVDLLYGELRLGQRGIGLTALRLPISRNRTTAIAIIGTTTMNTKKSRSRLRKLGFRSCVLIVGVAAAAGRPLHRGSYNRSFTMRESIPSRLGAIAQLGERLDRTQEVGGSSPPSSTRKTRAMAQVFALRELSSESTARKRWPGLQLARLPRRALHSRSRNVLSSTATPIRRRLEPAPDRVVAVRLMRQRRPWCDGASSSAPRPWRGRLPCSSRGASSAARCGPRARPCLCASCAAAISCSTSKTGRRMTWPPRRAIAVSITSGLCSVTCARSAVRVG